MAVISLLLICLTSSLSVKGQLLDIFDVDDLVEDGNFSLKMYVDEFSGDNKTKTWEGSIKIKSDTETRGSKTQVVQVQECKEDNLFETLATYKTILTLNPPVAHKLVLPESPDVAAYDVFDPKGGWFFNVVVALENANGKKPVIRIYKENATLYRTFHVRSLEVLDASGAVGFSISSSRLNEELKHICDKLCEMRGGK